MTHPLSVLVLGATGMLGSTVVRWIRTRHPDWRVDGAARQAQQNLPLEVEAGRPGLSNLFRLCRYDYVINCIGVLKGGVDERRSSSVARAIRVNALFPHEVADVAAEQRSRVIHISSDAVFSGRQKDPYTEAAAPDPIDTYGMTKVLGESAAPNVLNVRCSIVGRDSRQRGLIEWYLAATADAVTGYTDYVWTPVTTLQVADLCEALMLHAFDDVRGHGHILHFSPNSPLSKVDFLHRLRETAGRGASIEPKPGPGGPCYRLLASDCTVVPTLVQSHSDWSGLLTDLLAEFSTRSV